MNDPRANKTNYDVIIVGAGPAGLATGLHLIEKAPQLAERMVVLEKSRHPRFKACAGGLSNDAVRRLNGLGVDAAAGSLRIDSARLVLEHTDYTTTEVHLATDIQIVAREDLDAAMLQHARQKGLTVRENEPVQGIQWQDDAVMVRTGQELLKTKIVVGADGARSIVRRNMLAVKGLDSPQTLVPTLYGRHRLNDPTDALFSKREVILDFARTFTNGYFGYSWIFPFRFQGQAWVNSGIGGVGLPGRPQQPLKSIWSDFIGEHRLNPVAGKLYAHPLRVFHPRSVLSTDRALLVGDAAGIDPLLGEGISFSLAYGRVAAEVIESALITGDVSFSTYPTALLNSKAGQLLNRLYETSLSLQAVKQPVDLKKELLPLLQSAHAYV